MKTEAEELEFEKWAFMQEMDARDIADAICDCPALAEAVRNSDWRGVMQLVKSRIELKALHIFIPNDYRLFNIPTPVRINIISWD